MNILGMNIDWFKLLILLIIGLLVVGPEKLPAYVRKTARFVRNFEKVTKNLTGEISKAINLDDEEDGKTSDIKNDLIAVKKSLEKDVADLKATLDNQAKAISETMESGTREAATQLENNAREISEVINTQSDRLEATSNTKGKAVPEAVESGIKEPATSPEQSGEQVSATVIDIHGNANAPVEVEKEPPASHISTPSAPTSQ